MYGNYHYPIDILPKDIIIRPLSQKSKYVNGNLSVLRPSYLEEVSLHNSSLNCVSIRIRS